MTGTDIVSCRDQGIGASAGRIRELDALRGIAALVVVFHHVFVIFDNEIRSVVTGGMYEVMNVVQAQNRAAVLFFFVLSGYAIGLATRDRPPINGPALRYYAKRRARRILPLYYFSLAWTAIFGVVYGLDRESFSWTTLLGNALFLQTSASALGTWFVPYGDNGPYWSLSYEVFFYLTLPAVLALVQRSTSADKPGPALIGIGLIACFTGLTLNVLAPSPFALFLCYWIVWLVGYAVVWMTPGLVSVLFVLAPAAITAAVLSALAKLGYSSDTLMGALEGCLIAGVLAFISLYPAWTRSAVLRLARRILVVLFAKIGEGSYALYLLHYPLLLGLHEVFMAPPGAGAAAWWAGLGGIFVFVTLFCPWLERRLMMLGSLAAAPERKVRT